MTPKRTAALAAFLFTFAAAGVLAHDDDSAPKGEKLGKVRFVNSCSPAVQGKFAAK